jgi:hypothetical protein
MANIIGGVTNKYNQLFANQFIANLVNQDKIIQRADIHTLEIFNPASPVCVLRLRSSDRFVDISNAAGLTINTKLQINKDADPTSDFSFIDVWNGNATVNYFSLLLRAGKVTLKNQQAWPLEINSPANVILNAGANILAKIAGLDIMQITSQGIKTTSQIEDITTTFVDGSVVDADKNVFVNGIIVLNTGSGPASCQVEVSPDGVTWYVLWKANMPPGLGNISQSFCVYIPAGWRMQRVGANFTRSNLFKTRL